MDTEEVVLCTYCNKEVAKANFDLHEPHCQRFLCLCPVCNDSIPRDQLEDHNTEQHAQVRCQMCNKKMERRYLLDHETDECPERLQSCEYCELELPLSSLLKHCLSCGSRTSLCFDCGRYIQFQHQIQHARDCSKTPLTMKDPQSEDDESDEQPFVDNLEEHELEYKQSLQFEKSKNVDFNEDLETERFSPRDTADLSFLKFHKAKEDKYMERDKISTCKFCHLALPIKTLEWHEKKCELHKHLNTMLQ